jgi:hypothetical protein
MKKQKKVLKNTSTQPTKIEQQLNINITPHVFEALAKLEQINPEKAKKALELLEYDIKEMHKEKQKIIELEIKEQQIRKEELPYIRKLAFRGQLFAFITSFAGLGVSLYFGYLGMEKAAIVSISVTIGILAINFIEKKRT